MQRPRSHPIASHRTVIRATVIAGLLLHSVSRVQAQEAAPTLDSAALAARQVERGDRKSVV